MRLAPSTAIKVGTQTLTVRPTLRAASLLLESHGSLNAIADGIEQGSWTVIRDVLSTCGAHSNGNEFALAMIDGAPMGAVLAAVSNPVIDLLLELAGIDRNAKAQEGPKVTIQESHRRLFAIATGWLGWTPDAAWNATPAEIIEAHKGLIEKLRAIHGGKDDDKSEAPSEWDGTDIGPDRAGLDELKAMQ